MSTPHPAVLEDVYGIVAAEPIVRARFTRGDATPVTVVPLEGSELSWDASRWPRCTATLRLPTTITPTLLPDAISAYGGRVTLTVGQRWGGQEHTFTAATLAVAQVDVSRPDGIVTVECVSYEALINEDRYDTSAYTSAGKVSALVQSLAWRTLTYCPVSNTLGTLDDDLARGAYELDGDVWPVIETMLDDAGGEGWFDAAGGLVLRPVPVPGTPVLTIKVGGAGGTLTGYDSSRVWGYNRVVRHYRTATEEARLSYKWQAPRTASPPDGHVSVNTGNAIDASALYLNRKGISAADVAETYAGMGAGDVIRVVQELDGADRVLRYNVTGRPTIGATIVTVPVDIGDYRIGEPPDEADVSVTLVIKGRSRVGVWQDDRTDSLTSMTGPYGRHTYRETIDVERGNLPSQDNADKAARQIARRVVGRFRTVTVRAVPAPWLLPGDTVRLTMLGGLTEDHVIQAVSFPLPALDVMEIQTRDSTYTGGPF